MEPLRLDDSMSSAGAKLCRMFTAILRDNVQGAIKGEDTEYVHQMRVAVRKLRFILQFWNPLFDKKKTNSLNEELKWLAGELGQARDADILLQRFEAQWEGAPAGALFSKPFRDFVVQELSQKRTAAKESLIAALSSDRYKRLLSSLAHLFDWKNLKGEDPPLKHIVPDLFGTAIKKAGRYAGRKLDNSELHALRIAFKRLRYIAECFGELYRGKLRGHLRQFKKFQDILGNYCDAQVAELFLYRLAAGREACTPEARQRCLELGGLIFLQRLDAAKQYRRFRKKIIKLPERLKILHHRTKQM